ncbi:MAG TPA: GT4 family glycosyltransferase PelF [Tepiditoga sp.]|nr:GT4 family glycosyltransferase PelF [Tepiditoga sp.]
MKIGILFEGTYPYVQGGVSSWAASLMRNEKNVDFVAIHVGANPIRRLPKYKFSDNIKDYFEFFLFSSYKFEKQPVTDEFMEELVSIIRYPFEEIYMGEKLFNVLKKYNNFDYTTLIKNDIYWDFIIKLYNNFIPYENFNYYYWNLRSMLLPFLNALTVDIPVCDVYHSVTTGYAGLTALMASLRYNKPYIITEHGIYHRERQLDLLRSKWVKDEYRIPWIRLFNTISALTYYGAAKVTTLFKKNQQIEKELCDDHSKLEIIPNGIDYNHFSSIEKEEKTSVNIGLVGRVVEIKDIKTALKSIKIVSESISEVKFYIIGPTDEEPDYFKECKEMIDILNIGDIVEFTGMADVSQWYSKLDIVVLSSVSEGQPLVLLEAMASGIPCVSTDVGACSEIIYGTGEDNDIDGKCGLIVKPKDFSSMAKAINELIENKEFYNSASEIGKKRVHKRYMVENMIEKYDGLYTGVYKKWLESDSGSTDL